MFSTIVFLSVIETGRLQMYEKYIIKGGRRKAAFSSTFKDNENEHMLWIM